MSRPKYQLNETDFIHACTYISSKRQNFEFEMSEDASKTDAKTAYFDAVQSGSRKARSERLNAWFEKYLSSKDWRRLPKKTLAQSRKRIASTIYRTREVTAFVAIHFTLEIRCTITWVKCFAL